MFFEGLVRRPNNKSTLQYCLQGWKSVQQPWSKRGSGSSCIVAVLPKFFREDVSLIQYTSGSKLDELAASVWSFLELWIHHGIDVTASQVDNLLDREEFASLAEVGESWWSCWSVYPLRKRTWLAGKKHHFAGCMSYWKWGTFQCHASLQGVDVLSILHGRFGTWTAPKLGRTSDDWTFWYSACQRPSRSSVSAWRLIFWYWGLNSHGFRIIGDGHHPNWRGVDTRYEDPPL